MEKLKKTARVLDRLAKIVYWLNIAAFIIALILLAVMWLLALLRPDFIQGFHTDLIFGPIRFTLADTVSQGAGFGIRYLVSFTFLTVIHLPLWCMMFRTIRHILQPMKEGLPFAGETASHLKKLGWLIVAHGVVTQLGTFVTTGNLLSGYDLDALFLSDQITRIQVSSSFDFSFVLYALILFLLSYVFRYGCELQQLSDETL